MGRQGVEGVAGVAKEILLRRVAIVYSVRNKPLGGQVLLLGESV